MFLKPVLAVMLVGMLAFVLRLLVIELAQGGLC